MTVQYTSLLQYENIKKSIAKKHLPVYLALDRAGVTSCADVARMLGTAHHKISGRVTELKKLGRVRVVCRDLCPVGGNLVDFIETCLPPKNYQDTESKQLEMPL